MNLRFVDQQKRSCEEIAKLIPVYATLAEYEHRYDREFRGISCRRFPIESEKTYQIWKSQKERESHAERVRPQILVG